MIKIMEILSKITWIPAVIITALLLFTDNCSFDELTNLIFASVGFAVLALLWGKKGRCPYCKHFGTIKRISDYKTIGSTERNISRRTYDYHSGVIYDLSGNVAYYAGNTSRRENGTATTKTYTYNRRCSFCGCVDKVKESVTSKQY